MYGIKVQRARVGDKVNNRIAEVLSPRNAVVDAASEVEYCLSSRQGVVQKKINDHNASGASLDFCSVLLTSSICECLFSMYAAALISNKKVIFLTHFGAHVIFRH